MNLSAPRRSDLRSLRTVLFDLDGTLLDTARDLAFALNTLLHERGGTALSLEEIRPVVSLGSPSLIALGFGEKPGDPDYDTLCAGLLDIYRDNLAHHTCLFPGMDEVLAQIETSGRTWGIVTNKPGWLTEPLLLELGLAERAVCVVSGDTLEQRKPHPAQLLYASAQAGSTPSQCIYVGDAPRDIEAGQRAGMRTAVALFGYIPAGDDPLSWGADWAMDSPGDLLRWLSADS